MAKEKLSVLGGGVLCLCLALTFSACGGIPAAAPAPSATPAVPQARQAAGMGRPAWVDSVDSVYSRSQYIAALGTGNNRPAAEKNALAALVAIFGQSIQVDENISTSYQQAVQNGVTASWSENTAIQNSIATSASMDTLVGAEIKEVWDDSNGTFYAVAAMERLRTVQIYSDMITSNQGMIDNLVTMSDAEKNTLEGFSRYQLAATVADMNISYGNVLSVVGVPPPAGLQPGDDYRLDAVDIAQTIPVAVSVTNDRAGRIQSAFSKAFSDFGFRVGGTNSRYRLEADLNISEVQLPNQTVKFARYVVDSNLVDTASGKTVLLPYNIDGREGHITASEAETRAVAAAERKINGEYAAALSAYLSQLLPKR